MIRAAASILRQEISQGNNRFSSLVFWFGSRNNGCQDTTIQGSIAFAEVTVQFNFLSNGGTVPNKEMDQSRALANQNIIFSSEARWMRGLAYPKK
jgi:hypothetical protein